MRSEEEFMYWKGFSREHRILYYVLGGVMLAVLLATMVSWILGSRSVISLDKALFSESVPAPIAQVTDYPFNLELTVDSIFFNEFLQGTDISLSPWISVVFLAIFWIAYMVLLSVSTYLSRLWYFVSTGVFIISVVFIKPEIALMVEKARWITGGLLLAFVFLSYYFHAFNKNVPLFRRIMAFLGLSGIAALIIYAFSGLEQPFLFLAAYAYPLPLILTFVAIFMVGHDIIASLLVAVTNSNTPDKNNWKHFYIISFIYLTNVALMYMNEIGMIGWRLLPVSPLLFFIIAWVLGLWGFKHRESQYEYLIKFNPAGALFYLAMGVIAFGTIGLVMATGNDPAFEVIEDFILYSQLGYGFIFLTYITSNFLQPLANGMKVWKVMYKPDTMPYFTYRLAGFITFLALMFVVNWEIPVYQSIAGYYNNLGDVHRMTNDGTGAYAYYLKAGQYGYNNHRSNYALAQMALEREKADDAIDFYKKSVIVRPTPFAYLNLSNLYLNQNRYFEALFALQDGLKKFPDNGSLSNNLGLLYARGNKLDSAIYFLNQAAQDDESRSTAYNNYFNLLRKAEIEVDSDSLELENEDDWINRLNRLAYLNSEKSPSTSEFQYPEGSMDRIIHAYLYNYVVNSIWTGDTTKFALIREKMGENTFFDRRINLGFALNLYANGNIDQALKLLREIRYGEPYWASMTNDVIAKIYMDLGDERNALEYFKDARNNGNQGARLGIAMALTRMSRDYEARTLWDSLKISDDPAESQLANTISSILSKETLEEASALSDPEKYQYILFKRPDFAEKLSKTFEKPEYRARYLLDLATNSYDAEHWEESRTYLEALEEVPFTDVMLVNEMNLLKVRLTLAESGYRSMPEIPSGLQVGAGMAAYLDASRALISGDSASAKAKIDKWAFLNPYNEEMILLGYRFYMARGEVQQAYNILENGASGNLYNIRLQKEYVRHCGRTGNTHFGKYALEDVKQLISEEDFAILSAQYAADIEKWGQF